MDSFSSALIVSLQEAMEANYFLRFKPWEEYSPAWGDRRIFFSEIYLLPFCIPLSFKDTQYLIGSIYKLEMIEDFFKSVGALLGSVISFQITTISIVQLFMGLKFYTFMMIVRCKSQTLN